MRDEHSTLKSYECFVKLVRKTSFTCRYILWIYTCELSVGDRLTSNLIEANHRLTLFFIRIHLNVKFQHISIEMFNLSNDFSLFSLFSHTMIVRSRRSSTTQLTQPTLFSFSFDSSVDVSQLTLIITLRSVFLFLLFSFF